MPVPSATAPGLELEALYRFHHGWIRQWLQRKLGNAQDAGCKAPVVNENPYR
ncbi:hypothetical protein PputGB1_0698 [Pseudomonas putida GB-1]|uniref:Uncharacterized protein n=1 Tax=Pseudomonas putida (strain GB-1) TaxID=76869 RepID=B0KMD2_PSEPG|nr:hypothetical protein PputGB1_0698 [Pseudomonas putida GB-1]